MIHAVPLARILRQNLRRNLRHILLSSIGIVLGIAAFVFFWGLSSGVSKVVLHDIFPIDRVEVVVPKTSEGATDKKLDDALVAEIAARPEVRQAFPKMEMRFPASGEGGLNGASFRFEVAGFCDGIDPALVAGDPGMDLFKDWEALEAGKMQACGAGDASQRPGAPVCPDFYYCAADNLCHHRVPVLAGRTLVELYNASFAPSHNLPRVGKVQEAALKGLMKTLHFQIRLGESVFQGKFGDVKAPPETVEAMPVGISDKAMPLGMTVPIGYMRRWNTKFAGPDSTKSYSSIVVDLKDRAQLGQFVSWVHKRGYENAESQAERISLVIVIVTALFVVIAFSIMFISAVNISHTFFMIVSERRREIGLLRALGASRFDVSRIILGEAAIIGAIGGSIGVGAALGVARLIDLISANNLPDYPYKPNTYFAFSPVLVAVALGFAILFCVLGAALPARQATRIQPAQALSG